MGIARFRLVDCRVGRSLRLPGVERLSSTMLGFAKHNIFPQFRALKITERNPSAAGQGRIFQRA